MSPMTRETRRLKQKRRRITSYTLLFAFALLMFSGTGFFIALLGAIFFATVARMSVSSELEDHYKIVYPGGRADDSD